MKQQRLLHQFECLSRNLMTDMPEFISTQQCKEWIDQYENSEQINFSLMKKY